MTCNGTRTNLLAQTCSGRQRRATARARLWTAYGCRVADSGLAGTAVDLRRELVGGADDTILLRVIIQSVDDFAALDDDDARRAFLAEPPGTGDPRYDALLAGVAVHLVQRAGMPTTPAWTRDASRYLPRMWWVGLPEGSARRAYVLQRTPAYLKARGVLFNTDNLDSV